MKRLAAALGLMLAACPPTLDPHGTKCLSDSDCAPGQGLVCTAGLCADPGSMGGGGGGGGEDGGVDAGGGGGGGGGGMDAGRTQVVTQITPGAGDGGACSGGDGTETRWSDGSALGCADVSLCPGADGGAMALPYTPELVLIAQLVGEPRPDLVVLEQRKLHVLENLGGFAFVERSARALGVAADPTRLFGACLDLAGPTRTVMAATRQTGQPGPLLYCPAGADCAVVSTWGSGCVDAVAGPFIGDGYDDLVVSTPAKLGILQGNLTDYGMDYGLMESGLSPVFHAPDGTPYFGAYEDMGEWRLIHLPDNNQYDAVGQSFISSISLSAIEAYGLSALLARYDSTMNGPQLELIDVHDGGTFLRGSTTGTTVSTTRMIPAHFSPSPASQRACAIVSTLSEVDRWQIIPNGDALAFTTMTALYQGKAADLVSGDLDGDGLEDLVIAPASGSQLVILKGR